ncbi:partner of Y14 and mago-like isoform X2 [Montipora foliosa]|uniref:partner of Y14 and mago-like isoform X2 n=1 Tax=Montipora foliosa TaxID=591990 RepID=UPI0035F21CD2
MTPRPESNPGHISGSMSKSASKHKRKAEKRAKARIHQIKENGINLEAIEMKDPSALLREQLQEAKSKKDHDLAARLRQQLWIAQDNAAGVSMAEVQELGADVASTKMPNSLTAASAHAPSTEASGLTSIERRLKQLKKKLQQIKGLKEKRDRGEVLEKTQLDKISREEEVLEEIQEIETLLVTGRKLL